MEAAYYKEYYHLERKHWYFRARNQIIMDHIRSITNGSDKLKILNVGAGTGFTSELLDEFGDVKSLEYDQACYEFVKEQLDIDIIQGSILELPFEDNSYDLVCAFDVIEHIEDDQTGVDELLRVCKPEGATVVTVPAFMSLWSNHDVVNHHFRRYREKQLMSLFSNKKGSFLYHSYYNTWLFPPIALFRRINNLFKITSKSKEDTGSDFGVVKENSVISKFLYSLFYSESRFVRNNTRLPFGVSLIASWKKS